jgi:hypothetical protein
LASRRQADGLPDQPDELAAVSDTDEDEPAVVSDADEDWMFDDPIVDVLCV